MGGLVTVRRVEHPAALADFWPTVPGLLQQFAWVHAAIGTRYCVPCWLVAEQAGAVVAVLPLAIRRRRLMRIAEWSGVAVTDHCGPIPPSLHPAILAAFAQALRDLPVDIVRLEQCRVDPVWTGFAAGAPIETARIDSALPFAEYWSSRSANLRSRIGRARRKLARAGRYQVTRQPAAPGPALDGLCTWKRAQQPGSPAEWDQRIEPFVRRAAALPGMILDTITIDDQPIAVHLGWIEDGVLHYWLPGYDAAWAGFSPGHVLLLELIEAAHRDGVRAIDLLRGVAAYKDAWATDTVVLSTRLHANTLAGRAALWLSARGG